MNNEISERQAMSLQKLSPEIQFAIVNCLPNIPFGVDWGLCDLEETKEYLEDIKQNKNIFAMPVNGGVVLHVNPEYLMNVCESATGGLISKDDLKRVQERQKEVYEAFNRFIKKNNDHKGFIGIYCTNSVANIRFNDTDYPAFRLNLENAYGVLATNGFKVELSDGSVINAEVALNMVRSGKAENMKAISKSLIMSPTKTGVFLKWRR